jgi:hypothetical protein
MRTLRNAPPYSVPLLGGRCSSPLRIRTASGQGEQMLRPPAHENSFSFIPADNLSHKSVISSCVLRNLTRRILDFPNGDVDAFDQSGSTPIQVEKAYWGSSHKSIPVDGSKPAGISFHDSICPTSQNDRDCAMSEVKGHQEFLLIDRKLKTRFSVTIN